MNRRLRNQVIRERSAGVVPLRRTPDGYRLLVLRSFRSWDFPKGRCEDGETLLAAALRETKEEADLDDLTFPWGKAYCTTQPYGRGKVASYFLAETMSNKVVLPINPALGRPEHHEGRWVTFSQAALLLPARLQPVLAWTRNVVLEGREARELVPRQYIPGLDDAPPLDEDSSDEDEGAEEGEAVDFDTASAQLLRD